MNGFYLIDKPLEFTSFDVLRVLRKKTQTKKMWHTWTLDPLASGLLLVAFWASTKLIQYLEKSQKTYEFELSFKWSTDSYDAETELHKAEESVYDQAKKDFQIEQIQKLLNNKFTWDIEQIPPSYSALKQWWKRVVDRVRAWEAVTMKKRASTIYAIKILHYEFPHLTLQATVSAWTYIRSIAHDLWQLVWTWAYVTKLRRTWIGNLNLRDTPQELDNFDLQNKIEQKKLFTHMSDIQLNESQLKKLNFGQVVENIEWISDWIYLRFEWDEVSHIIEVEWDEIKVKRKI